MMLMVCGKRDISAICCSDERVLFVLADPVCCAWSCCRTAVIMISTHVQEDEHVGMYIDS